MDGRYITKNRGSIEIVQWSYMNGYAAVVYTEYLRNIKEVTVPIRRIKVPAIKNVERVMNDDRLYDGMLDRINRTRYYQKYHDRPEFNILEETEMVQVLDDYIWPNVRRHIPETISIKFGLNTDQQLIQEDSYISILEEISDYHLDFIAAQIAMNLVVFAKSINKSYGSDNQLDTIISINNPNAICPVYVDPDLVSNPYWSTIEQVTNSHVSDGRLISPTNELKRYEFDT